MTVQLPDTPMLFAGGVGGPAVMFSVTPLRNALVLGSTNTSASAAQLYQQAFSKGIASGWTGGRQAATAACPQFLALGPAYHFYASFAGVGGGVLLCAISESLIVYGAETSAAQLAKNQKSPGTIPKVQSVYNPIGPGFGIHVLRNIISAVGLRVFCKPCTLLIEKASGQSNAATQVGGDLMSNVISACLSAPISQLWAFTVTTPEISKLSSSEKRSRMIQFLKDQYLETKDGRTRLSRVVRRDLFMRSMYIGILQTMYVGVERSCISFWARSS
eukprot:TRINITY_DN53808_c0_g1_i1.p1 TRINITY_DN53808_c0_g1~~TRINITY_DN53808_c0_g1_i1.p1  ORF type:complete len:282 (-),score=28.79 TRINITY_DN53808_c0_g1_i1:149-970(-)